MRVLATKLELLLTEWEKNGGKLSEQLDAFGNYVIERERDAKAVCRALDCLWKDRSRPAWPAAVRELSFFFQKVKTKAAAAILRDQGLPYLRDMVEQSFIKWSYEDDIVFYLKLLAMYRVPEDVSLIVKAVRKPIAPDNFFWTTVFDHVDEEHPAWRDLLDGLRSPLPEEFICVVYLDFANNLAVKGLLDDHPFNTEKGIQKLEEWLAPDSIDESYAVSSVTALPFINPPDRDRLFQSAMNNDCMSVKIESAWAMGKLGMPEGIRRLKEFGEDVRYSTKASEYLKELGYENELPAQAMDPDFQAMAMMCEWLEYPTEYGRPPDAIEVYDSRSLFWPPANDRLDVWLLKYTYSYEGGEDDIGIGMVGSTTFSLFSQVKPDMIPEDVYSLHCCWELEMNGDSRAPDQRSVEAGRKILAKYNSGF